MQIWRTDCTLQTTDKESTKYMKQYKYTLIKVIELKEEIENSTITVGGFNTSLSIIDGTKQKTNKETEDLNNTIN